ncbi:MAG: hypothetical protein ACJAT1_000480 [Marivirga sp.]
MRKEPPFQLSHLSTKTVANCFGTRQSINEIIENAEIILADTLAKNNDLLLIDYTKVEFSFAMSDAFNLAKMFELNLQEFHQVKMAVIITEKQKDLGVFWKEISQTRGFNFEVSTDKASAERWLLE